MSIESMITRFGYPALVIGLLFEGETMLVLGVFMAHRGYLNLPLVIIIGCIVAFSSDQFFFWMGRTRGSQFLEKRPAWQPHVERQDPCLAGIPTSFFLESVSCMVCGPSFHS